MKAAVPEFRPQEIDREVTTFKNHYSEIIKNVGKFVLIHGDHVVEYYESYPEAIAEGYRRFNLDSFLVRRVTTTEVPISVLRCGVKRMDNRLRLVKAKS